MGVKVTLILSTYNKPRELECSLASVQLSDLTGLKNFQVVVADDGSGPETAEVVEKFSKEAPFEILHLWQPDDGFRLAAIRNKAIDLAGGDVIVFVDADSLLHPSAVRYHAERCLPGVANAGARSLLGPVESNDILDGSLSLEKALRDVFPREKWRRRRQYLKNWLYRITGFKIRPKLLGGNCSVHRQDLLKINGFDERFVGWGLEDDDLARRLRRLGVRIRDSTLDCLVLHIFHLTHPSHRPTIHHTPNYKYFHLSHWSYS